MNTKLAPPMSTRTGTTQAFKYANGTEYWRARVTLASGERKYVGGRFETQRQAAEYAKDVSTKIRAQAEAQIADTRVPVNTLCCSGAHTFPSQNLVNSARWAWHRTCSLPDSTPSKGQPG